MIQTWNGIAATWLGHMTSAVWQASLVALFVVAIVRLARPWPSSLRYGLTVIALLKFALPATLTLPTSVLQWVPSTVAMATASRPELPPLPVLGPMESALVAEAVSSVPPAAAAQSARPSAGAWLLILYCCGALAVSLRVVLEVIRWRQAVRRSAPITEGPLHDMLMNLARQLRLRRTPRLLLSRDECAPCAFGFLAPKVMLPERYATELGSNRLRLVLAHELAHHRRADLWVNALQTTLSIVWWFNPAYWLLARQVRSTREDCCDDLVLVHGWSDRTTYCEVLLHAARVGLRSQLAPMGLACRLGTHPLGRRLARIMRPRFRPSSGLTPLHAALLLAAALALVPGASRHSVPQAAPLASSKAKVSARDVESARRDLRATDPVVRARAARTLGEAQAFDAVPHLVVLLADETPIEDLPAWRDQIDWSPALESWVQPSPGETAAIALASMSGHAVPALIEALSDGRRAVRRNAAWALGESHSPRLPNRPEVPALLRALQDSEADVRGASAWALGETKDRRATTALSAALTDPDAGVRTHAARALGEICDPGASDALLLALQDPDSTVREAASWALEEIIDRVGDSARSRGY